MENKKVQYDEREESKKGEESLRKAQNKNTPLPHYDYYGHTVGADFVMHSHHQVNIRLCQG